ncbi:hypothetical protein BDY24DRAFT_412540 [Mrakia frigida]|uniref:uncharacterized protein n=1 Tax=Mrakia frigida TaxID=29902 RepID=UPI003FCC116E
MPSSAYVHVRLLSPSQHYGYTRLFSHLSISLITSLTFLNLGSSVQDLQYRVFAISIATVLSAIVISQVDPIYTSVVVDAALLVVLSVIAVVVPVTAVHQQRIMLAVDHEKLEKSGSRLPLRGERSSTTLMIIPTPSILAAQEPPPRWDLRRPVSSLTRLSHRVLKIIALTFTFVVFLLSIIFAGKRLTSVSDDGTTSGMKALGVIIGLIYLAFAAVNFGGAAAGLKDDARLFRLYSLASLVNIGLIGVAGILDVVSHFAFKSAINSQCRSNSTGKEFTPEGESEKVIYTEEEAINYCNELYKKNSWGSPVWMILAILLASIASLLAFAYAQKLVNLQSSSSFPINAVRPPHDQQDHDLRPYPSSQYTSEETPAYTSPSSIKPFLEPASKTYINAQEDAWNQATLSSPEREERKQHRDGTGSSVGMNKAEEQAWEEAQSRSSQTETSDPFSGGGSGVERGGGRG